MILWVLAYRVAVSHASTGRQQTVNRTWREEKIGGRQKEQATVSLQHNDHHRFASCCQVHSDRLARFCAPAPSVTLNIMNRTPMCAVTGSIP